MCVYVCVRIHMYVYAVAESSSLQGQQKACRKYFQILEAFNLDLRAGTLGLGPYPSQLCGHRLPYYKLSRHLREFNKLMLKAPRTRTENTKSIQKRTGCPSNS